MPLGRLDRNLSSKSNTGVRKSTIKHFVPTEDQHPLPHYSSETSTAQTLKPPTIPAFDLDRTSCYSDVPFLAEPKYSSRSDHDKPLPSRPQAQAQAGKGPDEQEASWYSHSTVVEEHVRRQSREVPTFDRSDREESLDLPGSKKAKELLDKQPALEPTFQHVGSEAFQNIDINEQPSEMPERTVKKKGLCFGVGILFVVLLIVVVILLSLCISGAFGSHCPKDPFRASNPSSKTSIAPITSSMIATTPGVATVMAPSPETDVASTVSATSVLDSSTTASQSSTHSPKISPSSIKSAPSSAAGSASAPQLVSTMTIEDSLVGRSGYIGLRDEAFDVNLILNRAQEAIVAGEPSIAYANEDGKREDEYTTTTITTTLTTTITSTLHTSGLAAAGVESFVPSVQPASDESEQESNNVSPTNESPTSPRDQSTSDTGVSQSAAQVGFNPLESTYATLSQTPDPTPTRPPNTTQTAQSRNTDASVLSASSSAAGARLGVPSWDKFQRLRQFLLFNPIGEGNRHILPSITPMPTVTGNDETKSGAEETSTTPLSTSNDNAAARRGLDLPPIGDLLSKALDLTTKVHLSTMIDFKSKGSATRTPLHTPSSNAAAPRHAAPWRRVTFMPTNPHRRHQATQTSSTSLPYIPKQTSAPTYPHVRRQSPSASLLPDSEGRKLTFWEAFSQLRLQAVQMCFDVKTYQDSTLTPMPAQKDLQMGKSLDEIICSTLDGSFPPVTQGGKCDTKSEWESLETKVGEVCNLQKMGEKLVQDLEKLCGVKDVYAGNLDTCGSEASGMGSAMAGWASNLTANSSGSPAADSVTGSSALSNATNSESLSITLQQHGITSPTPDSTAPSTAFASTPPLPTSTNALSPTLSTPPKTTVAACPAVPETPLPSSCIGKLPSHHKFTPPPDWTIPMLTYSTQAANYTSLRTIPANAVATPPIYTGPQLSRNWPVSYAFPIPTGYVAPNIVPASPQIGQLTYFNPGLGACAEPNMASNELAVAISWELFDMGREIGESSFAKDWFTAGH
ncbi:repeatmulti-domain protein [Pyrenophora tritici-repentis]|nr:repeatmulti-domain protein [Pyrenophora tritici-repentis]